MAELKLVGVYTAGSEVEAEIVKGRLQSAGIPAMVQNRGLDEAMMGYASGEFRVLVSAGREREARAVLASSPNNSIEP